MRVCLVVNPLAGKNRGSQIASDAVEMLQSRSIDVELFPTSYARHAIEIVQDLKLDAWDGVIAVGGDGTLFETINGLMRNPGGAVVPVGQIPVGTGNSFIKDVGIETVEDAVAKIAAETTRPVDVGKLSCADGVYFFVNLLGAGFVSNVAYRARKYKAFGSFSYILGVFEELIGLKATNSKLVIDGQTFERECIFIEICNSKYTGGNMMMAPDARIDDGEFDVVVLNRISRRKLLKMFPTIFNGSHVDDDAVEVFRGKRIEFTTDLPLALTPDGETFGTTPITVEMLPGAVRMFG